LPRNPLAEVFGYPTDNRSDEAERFQSNRLCPFGNISLSCTKVSVTDPLGVCSNFHEGKPIITCPVRFNQDEIMVADAAAFFFPRGSRWIPLREVRLYDADGKSAGNIDFVLVTLDRAGDIHSFGALDSFSAPPERGGAEV